MLKGKRSQKEGFDSCVYETVHTGPVVKTTPWF